MPSLESARPGWAKDEPANGTSSRSPERNSRTHRCSASRLKFDVAELHHVRTGLHQPPAHYREVFGCAELEAQDQASFSDVVFQLASLVGAEPAMQCVRKASRSSQLVGQTVHARAAPLCKLRPCLAVKNANAPCLSASQRSTLPVEVLVRVQYRARVHRCVCFQVDKNGCNAFPIVEHGDDKLRAGPLCSSCPVLSASDAFHDNN